MALLFELRRRVRFVVLPVLGVAVIGYFLFHAVQGDRGLLTQMKLSREVAKRQAELGQLRAQRATLEHKVRHLRPNSLDLDLLEEQARAALNLAAPDERILYSGDMK